MPIVAREVLVEGHVQGVAFRHYTKLRARELGLCGSVQNLADGRVEVHVEGEADAVGELVRWLAHGPPTARVERTVVREVAPSGAARFEVKR